MMYFLLRTFALSIWLINTVEAIRSGCICAKNRDVIVFEQPQLTSSVASILPNGQCYTKTEVLAAHKHDWHTVEVGNKTFYIYTRDVEIRPCNYPHNTRFEGEWNGNSTNRSSPRNIVNRASTIGNTGICGRNLQLWVQQGSNRVLAQRDNRCYGIQIGLRQTYQYAFTYCQSSVSYLVDIMDEKEQAFIEMLVNRYLSGEKVWIGLHDVQNERFFDWTSGKLISYVNWFSTSQAFSSRNHDAEDCVALVPFRGGKWEVESCYTGNDATEPKHAFICEFEIKNPAQTVG